MTRVIGGHKFFRDDSLKLREFDSENSAGCGLSMGETYCFRAVLLMLCS
jgi:hypothetical protein